MSTHEDFEKWRKMNESYGGAAHPLEAWQAALSSRQPEIDALKADVVKWKEEIRVYSRCLTEEEFKNDVLKAENEKLRKAVGEAIEKLTALRNRRLLGQSEVNLLGRLNAAMTPDTKGEKNV